MAEADFQPVFTQVLVLSSPRIRILGNSNSMYLRTTRSHHSWNWNKSISDHLGVAGGREGNTLTGRSIIPGAKLRIGRCRVRVQSL